MITVAMPVNVVTTSTRAAAALKLPMDASSSTAATVSSVSHTTNSRAVFVQLMDASISLKDFAPSARTTTLWSKEAACSRIATTGKTIPA